MELSNTVELLVHVKYPADDYYIFDEENYELHGELTKKVYGMGQKVRVRVEDADASLKTIDFVLVEERGGHMAKKSGIKLIANNKRAFHDYFIEDTYEAGIALAGTEVKSLRMGKCSVKESFVRVENGEVYIYGMHISPYEKGNIFNKDPLGVRKLLLHRAEIRKLEAKLKEKGLTLVSLKGVFQGQPGKGGNRSCLGQKLYDKRQDIAKKISGARQSGTSRCETFKKHKM